MSELTLNVLDEQRTIHGRLHGSEVDRLVASLGADPETIAELQLAAGRFSAVDPDRPPLAGCRPGIEDEPWDAGLVYIDLTARIVCADSTHSCFIPQGQEYWHDGASRTDEALPFRLADDWLLAADVLKFHGLSQQRRAARAARPRIDERAVLYGRLPEKLVLALFAHRDELARAGDEERGRLIREVHADWLLTPLEELRGRAPRDLFLDERHHHIVTDLQWQQQHWSRLRQPPPAVPRDSAAYRLGGFGTHEIVLYYDLVRDMLWETAERWRTRVPDEAALPAEAEHLQRFRQDRLHLPNDDFHGRTAASIIDKERRRLPEKACGDEAVVDPDCPCCQMLADEEQFGPVFWHLDGCNMDDDFAFSFHRTREEWEAEQREWQAWSRELDERGDLDDSRDELDQDDVPF
jgi:hypothetical protein